MFVVQLMDRICKSHMYVIHLMDDTDEHSTNKITTGILEKRNRHKDWMTTDWSEIFPATFMINLIWHSKRHFSLSLFLTQKPHVRVDTNATWMKLSCCFRFILVRHIYISGLTNNRHTMSAISVDFSSVDVFLGFVD